MSVSRTKAIFRFGNNVSGHRVDRFGDTQAEKLEHIGEDLRHEFWTAKLNISHIIEDVNSILQQDACVKSASDQTALRANRENLERIMAGACNGLKPQRLLPAGQ